MKVFSRLHELDALRGLAALAILVHHNILASELLDPAASDLVSRSPFHVLTTGRQAVLFFFVLSGFVLTRSLRSLEGRFTLRAWLAWIVQRSIRLVLPAMLAVLISAVLYAVFYVGTWPGESVWLRNWLWQDPPTLPSLLAQGLLLPSTFHYEMDNVLWSLAVEWRISVLLPVVVAVAAFRGARAAPLLILGGLAVAGIVGGPWASTIGVGPGPVGHVRSTLYFMLPFAIGAALDRMDVTGLQADRRLTLCGLGAVAGLVCMGHDIADYLASALLIWLAVQPGWLRRVLRVPALQWLGRKSFSLYLVHELVMAPLHHGLHGEVPVAVLFGLSCLSALVAAKLFYRLIERRTHHLARQVRGWLDVARPFPALADDPLRQKA